jgi:hypothetical protein
MSEAMPFAIFVMVCYSEEERPAIATELAGLFYCGCKKAVMVIQAILCGNRNQFVRLSRRLCQFFVIAKLLREVDEASKSNSTGRPFLVVVQKPCGHPNVCGNRNNQFVRLHNNTYNPQEGSSFLQQQPCCCIICATRKQAASIDIVKEDCGNEELIMEE